MSSLTELHDMQNRLAIIALDHLRPGWSRATSVFVDVGVTSRLQRAVLRETSLVYSPPADLTEYQAWIDLRELMADDSHGAWFSGRLHLEQTGAYRFEFDWDSEPSWPVEVDLDGNIVKSERVETSQFREDLRRYPRNAEFIPSWLRKRLVFTGLRFADTWLEEFRALADHSNWLIVRDMLRDAVQAGTDDRGVAVGADQVAEVVSSELAASTTVGQIERLYRDATGLGLVPNIPEASSASSTKTRNALLADEAFRERFDALFQPLLSLAAQELGNVVRAR